jgi:nicotinate-nucleotide pyrophosphorylase (carboxylating)
MKDVKKKIQEMLADDLGEGDVTSEIVIRPDTAGEAEIIANQAGVLAGVAEAVMIFKEMGVKATPLKTDGSGVKAGDVIIRLSGPARGILAAERVALNILMRMSGIATATRELIKNAKRKNPKVVIAATRKTAPLLSYFDKKSVVAAGGISHRWNLGDQILIKDNHLRFGSSAEEAVRLAKKRGKGKIEIEVCTPEDVVPAAKAGADIIMLDNMTPAQIRRAVKSLKQHRLRKNVTLEASGGITLSNIGAFAATGVDVISASYMTMRAPALDMSLEVKEKGYKTAVGGRRGRRGDRCE